MVDRWRRKNDFHPRLLHCQIRDGPRHNREMVEVGVAGSHCARPTYICGRQMNCSIRRSCARVQHGRTPSGESLMKGACACSRGDFCEVMEEAGTQAGGRPSAGWERRLLLSPLAKACADHDRCGGETPWLAFFLPPPPSLPRPASTLLARSLAPHRAPLDFRIARMPYGRLGHNWIPSSGTAPFSKITTIPPRYATVL